MYKSYENLFLTDESSSTNRDSKTTHLGKFLDAIVPRLSGEKTIDDVLSYKVFRIKNFEITGYNLFFVLCIFIVVFGLF
jgi:hypothetical protein